MRHEATPAIVRDYDIDKDDVPVLSKPTDSVSHRRGLGDSGYRVQIVEHDCPEEHCSFDRMVRRVDVHPESRDSVRYWCLSPNCVHYVSDNLSYACSGSYPDRKTDEPAVWEGAP